MSGAKLTSCPRPSATRSNQSAIVDAIELGAPSDCGVLPAALELDTALAVAVDRGGLLGGAPTMDAPGTRPRPLADAGIGDELDEELGGAAVDGVPCPVGRTPAAAGWSPLAAPENQSLRRSCCRSTKPTVTTATASTHVTKRRQCTVSPSARPRTRRHAPHSMQRGAKPLIGRPQRRHRTIGIRRTGEVHRTARAHCIGVGVALGIREHRSLDVAG